MLTYLKDNVIIKHVFDTVHNIFCLRLSQFYWFWRGPEQWAKLGELRNGGQLFWRDTKNKESLLSTLEPVKHHVGAYIHFREDRAKRRKINPYIILGFNTFTRLPSLLHIASLGSSRNLHPQRSWGE